MIGKRSRQQAKFREADYGKGPTKGKKGEDKG